MYVRSLRIVASTSLWICNILDGLQVRNAIEEYSFLFVDVQPTIRYATDGAPKGQLFRSEVQLQDVVGIVWFEDELCVVVLCPGTPDLTTSANVSVGGDVVVGVCFYPTGYVQC